MKLHSTKLIFGSVSFDNATTTAVKRSEGSYGWKVKRKPVQNGLYRVEIEDPLDNSIEPVVTVTPFDPVTSSSISNLSKDGFDVNLKSVGGDTDGDFGFVFIQNDP